MRVYAGWELTVPFLRVIISSILKILIKIVLSSNIVFYELEHVKQYALVSRLDFIKSCFLYDCTDGVRWLSI